MIEVVDTTGIDTARDNGADAETRPPKPCSRRLPGNCWCLLPDRHEGDCHGVTSAEAIGVADFGPKRAVRR